MNGILKYTFFCLMSFLALSSCIEDQDFGQADQIELTPTYQASLLYIEAPESLVNDAPTNVVFSRDFDFDAFSSDDFAERVIEVTLTYIVENTTSKELSITVELLDANDNVLDTEIIPVEPAPAGQFQRDIAYGDAGKSINIIINTSSIRVSATNLGDNSSISDLPEPKIILKSDSEFRVRLK